MEEKIRRTLESAICAPSGDNCQPWEFRLREQVVELFNRPDRDTSLYNFKQSASLVAHGALLENTRIAASALGLQADISLFPDPDRPTLVARITMKEGIAGNEPLFPYIAQRTTNRKPYRSDPLSEEERKTLLAAAEAVAETKIYLIEERRQIAALARIARMNDQLVFENRNLHDFLFEHIRWTDQEAAATRDGLDLKTLELNPLDRIGFKLLKNWPLVEKLNIVGLSKIASKNAEKLALSASAIGLITARGEGREDLIHIGRAMQRVWLEATSFGLSFQLMTGITFLMDQVRRGATGELTPNHVETIKKAEESLKNIFSLKAENPAVLFRVGRSARPSARSVRYPLERLIVST